MQSAKRTRLVVDTNVLISILIGKELGKLKPLLRSGQVQLALSPILLDEFKAVVERPHLRKYFAPSTVDRFISLVSITGLLATDVPPPGPVSRDPKDDYLLMLAATSGATLLITGDKDLLAIGSFKKVQIIKPSELMQELAG